MIDKLDLRLPADTRFQREVQEFLSEGELSSLFRRSLPSHHYHSITDLRPLGIDALLHRSLTNRGTRFGGSHKLEIIDSGTKGFSDWNLVIQRIIRDSPDSLQIMRIDTCADVADVSVAHFYGRMRVKFKRSNQGIGDSQWRTISRKSIETITAGQRPNFVRIYDKSAERINEYQRLRKRNLDLPPFEQMYGHSPDAVISRVERQHTSRGVPKTLSTFGDLHHAPNYNPFTCMEIVDTANPLDFIEKCAGSANRSLMMAGYAAMRDAYGASLAARWYNRHSGGNLARFRRSHAELFSTRESAELNRRIFDEYRASTIRQLSL